MKLSKEELLTLVNGFGLLLIKSGFEKFSIEDLYEDNILLTAIKVDAETKFYFKPDNVRARMGEGNFLVGYLYHIDWQD